ncbi:MAG: hypothetical protein II931_03050 [Clostridia bacterium]|nr:hypothetical protein [Clostridia bacterium]
MSNIDESRLSETMDIIDRIAEIFEIGAKEEYDDEFNNLQIRLRELTGKPDIDISSFAEYWSWISLEDLARSVLMPTPEKKGLSDEEIAEIVTDICECEYSDSELGYYLELLKLETGLVNISDYIFYPNMVGLEYSADVSDIVEKVLLDRKNPDTILL